MKFWKRGKTNIARRVNGAANTDWPISKYGRKETSMVINFSDGISVDTTGELRVIRLPDGLYVAGRGFLIPVKDGEEAEATIREMSKNKGETPDDANG